MTILSLAESLGVTPRKASTSKGGEFSSACPMCGGSDRFRLWPQEDRWWCRGCGKGGDAPALLMNAKGLSYAEACRELGIEKKRARRPRTPVAPRRETSPEGAAFTPREAADPADLWRTRAEAFAGYAHRELLQNTQQLEWLAARGLKLESVKRFRLGWNPERLFRKRAFWGLPEDTITVEDTVELVDWATGEILSERRKTDKLREWLILPEGLVIPYHSGGRIHRLRIRRPEGEPRYYVVPGSGMAPMSIPSPLGQAWTVVESELDALLVAQDAGDATGALALGSVSTRPDGEAFEALKGASSILVALDSDEAGAKAWPWWQARFPRADRWPVPRGKDPGEFRKDGGDVRAWIIAGLPPGLRPSPASKTVEKPEAEKTTPADATAKTVPAPDEAHAGAPLAGTDYIAEDVSCAGGCGKTIEVFRPARGIRAAHYCHACESRFFRPWTPTRVRTFANPKGEDICA